jgi:Fe-S cluster assembly protein SufB
MVRMADGSHKPIEDVRTLDEVATAEGRRGRVLQTMVRRNTDSIAHVRLRGHNAFRSTREHPILARRHSGPRRSSTFTEEYTPAYELRPGDYVALTRYQPEPIATLEVNGLVDIREVHGAIDGRINTGGVMSDIAPLPSILFKDRGLGRLLGLYAAEGHTTVNKVVWTFGKHEADLVNETMALVKDVLEAQPRIQQRPNNSTNVVLYGKTWRLLFERLVPGTSRHGDKRLSPEVTASPPEFLAALLDGWLDGDGHRRRTGCQGVTVCQRLALDMHAIAQILGRRPTLGVSTPSPNKYAATRQDRWDILIGEGDGKNVAEQTDTAVWRRVIRVELEPHDGWVFNLHVEGDESYVANGVGVHNCVGSRVAPLVHGPARCARLPRCHVSPPRCPVPAADGRMA